HDTNEIRTISRLRQPRESITQRHRSQNLGQTLLQPARNNRPLVHPEADFHLSGRSFVLAPSVFCGPVPQLFASPEAETVVMAYQALHDPVDAAALWASPADTRRGDAPVPQALTALLGRTRAIVLCVIANHPACTTTQLAQRAGISPASASEHATTLRKAGLTAVTRERKATLHTLTHLGLTLLSTNGSTPANS
ncbi:winged helix-turn-helix domain-containing protein, partial [Kitasatospora sp. NPDC127067]|uniref:winged helix-turn-helix domain-containing protein n=1 Tax=Kitasatospora sp. NPDC127067 TaxID=3347126 RepID=UPI0036495969